MNVGRKALAGEIRRHREVAQRHRFALAAITRRLGALAEIPFLPRKASPRISGQHRQSPHFGRQGATRWIRTSPDSDQFGGGYIATGISKIRDLGVEALMLSVADAYEKYYLFSDCERVQLPDRGKAILDAFDYAQKMLTGWTGSMKELADQVFSDSACSTPSTSALAIDAVIQTIAFQAFKNGEIWLSKKQLTGRVKKGRLKIWDQLAMRLKCGPARLSR
jgi:hypothetical protein